MNTRDNSIGIVVPVYKVKYEYLKACVDSLINQTYKNISIVLVDDCSPDDCGKWCEEFAKIDTRIKVCHHEKNKGLPAARNSGIEMLDTDWVTFVDSDDWLDIDSCEKMVNYLRGWEKTPDMIIFTGYRNYPDREQESTAIFDKVEWFDNRDKILKLQNFGLNYVNRNYPEGALNLDSACWRLISVDYLNKNNIRFIDIPFKEDGLFFLYSTEVAESIVYVYEPLYHYRSTGNSMVNVYRPNADKEHLQYWEEIKKFIDKYKKGQDFVYASYYASLISMEICISQKFFNYNNKMSFFEKQRSCNTYLKNEPYKTALRKIRISQLRKNHMIKAILIKLKLYGVMTLARNMYNRSQKKTNYD